MRPHRWDHHPAVKSGDQLTRGERAADLMRNSMGSWGFVGVALAFLAGWMASGGFGVDAMPFILLNLCLSCLAALQGSILLIASKRQDQISSELAKHDYATNQQALQILQGLRNPLRVVDSDSVRVKLSKGEYTLPQSKINDLLNQCPPDLPPAHPGADYRVDKFSNMAGEAWRVTHLPTGNVGQGDTYGEAWDRCQARLQ